MLADVLGMTERKPLRLTEPKQTQYKLVTFVPVDAVERVSLALFEAGAGNIGNYSSCSFRSAGTGTFFGQEAHSRSSASRDDSNKHRKSDWKRLCRSAAWMQS